MKKYLVEIRMNVINEEEYGDLIAEKIFKIKGDLTEDIKEKWKKSMLNELKEKLGKLKILDFKGITYTKII